MQNHLFIIMAHNQPEMLQRIVGRLYSLNHYFYIHIDKKVDIRPFKSQIGEDDNIDWCEDNRIRVNWGGYSQIKCTLNLLRKSLTDNTYFDFIHLISGVDYPCVSNELFDDFFFRSNQRSFMQFDTPKEVRMWRNDKYSERLKWHFRDYKFLEKIMLPQILNRISPRKPMKGVYAGWNWFSWHRNVAEYVMNFLDNNKRYLNRFKYTSCCDEVIFHTLLYDVADKLNIEKYNALRYIDWHPMRPYKSLPLVLNMQDAERIKDSGCFFCRKCSLEESKELLDYLDMLSN